MHGLSIRPAANSTNVVNSRSYASWKRSKKPGYAGPPGQATPRCAERSGSRSSYPAAMLPAEPCASSRTSYPAALYRVAVTRASASSSMRSIAAAVSTSPAAAKNSSPRFEPVAYTSTTSRPVTQRIASKSCTLQSLKMPPEVAMYAAGGGAASAVIPRSVCTQPSDPLPIASRTAA